MTKPTKIDEIKYTAIFHQWQYMDDEIAITQLQELIKIERQKAQDAILDEVLEKVVYIETLLCNCEYEECEERGNHKDLCLYIQFRDGIEELRNRKVLNE